MANENNIILKNSWITFINDRKTQTPELKPKNLLNERTIYKNIVNRTLNLLLKREPRHRWLAESFLILLVKHKLHTVSPEYLKYYGVLLKDVLQIVSATFHTIVVLKKFSKFYEREPYHRYFRHWYFLEQLYFQKRFVAQSCRI